jgi:hypothetical protein
MIDMRRYSNSGNVKEREGLREEAAGEGEEESNEEVEGGDAKIS